ERAARPASGADGHVRSPRRGIDLDLPADARAREPGPAELLREGLLGGVVVRLVEAPADRERRARSDALHDVLPEPIAAVEGEARDLDGLSLADVDVELDRTSAAILRGAARRIGGVEAVSFGGASRREARARHLGVVI